MARYNVSGISVTPMGLKLGKKICRVLAQEKDENDLFLRWYHRPDQEETVEEPFIAVDTSLKDWVRARFEDSNVLVFIGTISRVFMLTASYAADHADNMAILVIDEFGRFCVPLLSGRRNEGITIARLLEKELSVTAVDMLSARKGHDFSIRRFARENRMTISNDDYAQEIMTALEDGKPVGLYTNYRFTGALPLGMEFTDRGEVGIYISPSYHNAFFERTLWLIPRCIIVRIDCKTDAKPKSVASAVETVFKQLNLYQEAIEKLIIPEGLDDTGFLHSFCKDRDIRLCEEKQTGTIPQFDEDGYEYQVICDTVNEDGIGCKVAMKNLVLAFLG